MSPVIEKTKRTVASPTGGDVVLAARNVAKAFGATQAIRDATVEFCAGETHAIVGENGSGKSTLVKLIAGVQRPDSGVLEFDGGTLSLASPREALRAKIVPVFQEVLVVGSQSVVDNLWMGTDGLWHRRVAETEKRRRGGEVLEALLGRDAPDLREPVEQLPLSVRQACGIARALLRDPRVLILDESTSALDFATRDRLFEIVRERNAAGATVIFISHRMDEIHEIGDRVTVMRSGETVKTVSRGGASSAELVQMMTGQEHLVADPQRLAREHRDRLHPVLRSDGVVVRPGASPIDLTVRAGEILGLAGLDGQGQDAFLRALGGHPHADGTVFRISETGEETSVGTPAAAAAAGVAYLPRDRRTESLFATLSIRDNFAAATVGIDRRRLLLANRRTDDRLSGHVERLRIRMASPGGGITTLSGGNQQKVVMARWLASEPDVLLLNDPTRGVDLGAKRDIYALLTKLAEDGRAVVMLSTEVDELVELADRVVVFREDQVFCQLERDGLSREALVSAFFGHVVGDV